MEMDAGKKAGGGRDCKGGGFRHLFLVTRQEPWPWNAQRARVSLGVRVRELHKYPVPLHFKGI